MLFIRYISRIYIYIYIYMYHQNNATLQSSNLKISKLSLHNTTHIMMSQHEKKI